MLKRIIFSIPVSILLLSCSKDYSVCIQGNVSDAKTEKAIPGVSVDLLRDDEWGENSYYTSVTTDENGNYSLKYANNDDLSNFKLFVSKDGYADTLMSARENKSNCVDRDIRMRAK